MSTIDDLKLLTVAELAEICGTGEDWIRKGVQKQALAYTRCARQIKFTRAQAQAIIADLEVKPAHVPTRDRVTALRMDAGPSGRRAA